MSSPDEPPSPRGSGRVLMLGTVVLVAAAAAVLALGAQDARLLRLGLIAALWAALLGAFAAARMRREISSDANRADELRTVYQLELEREVAARREHMLTVERELREQVEQTERGEIAALRADLAAMRANLEKLLGGDPLVERLELRAESARLLPMAAYRHKFGDSPSFDDRRGATAALGATAKVTQVAPQPQISCQPQIAPQPQIAHSLTAAGLSVRSPGGPSSAVFGNQDLRNPLPTSEWPVNGRNDTAPTPREDPELCFGPARLHRSELDTQVPSPDKNEFHSNVFHSNGSHSNGSHSNGAHSNGSHVNGSHNNGSHVNGSHNNGSHNNGSHVNGSHVNGSHVNGGGARRPPQEESVAGAQRSVNDLLAAHGASATPRRRRSREEGPQA
ncbi:MAG TPA: DUF6779 domain-containing protein [Pseudonocardiaceae bacterium]|nr:DUF6779 domain-containing protein [Pseudonocardiaceae bacterium]